MPSRLLITGATGFVGGWVLRHWRQAHPEMEIWATSRQSRSDDGQRLRYLQAGLLDRESIGELVRRCRPTHIVHLAGINGVASLTEKLTVNVLRTENLYDTVLDLCRDELPRIVQASSAATYGEALPSEIPIREDKLPRPLTAYGLSKLTQDYLAFILARTRGLPVVRARIFNVVGPGQADNLVPMTWIKQIRGAHGGAAAKLRVGRTSTRRDFVDVRDVATALDALLEAGVPGEAYNVASGIDVSIDEVVKMLATVSGLELRPEVEASRVREWDVPCVQADIEKITTDTGWRPSVSLQESLQAMWSAR